MFKKAIRLITSPHKKRKILGKIKYYRFLYHHKKKDIILPYHPLNIRIEPTNYCNLKCVMCPQSVSDRRRKGYMEMGLYNKIIEEIRNFSFPTNVILYLGGEPLLHKDFIEMIRIAKTAGLSVEVNTNATLLSGNVSGELLDVPPDLMVISFDDEESGDYEAIRINASHKDTLSNIINFLKLKKRLKRREPLVIISGLKLLKGGDYIDDARPPKISDNFLGYFKDLPVEAIRSDWAHGWAGDFKERGHYHYKTKSEGFKGDCPLVFRDISIAWDGRVFACCYDLEGDVVLGDLKRESIMDIWNGKPMVDLRRKLINKEAHDLKLCKNCVLLKGEINFFKRV